MSREAASEVRAERVDRDIGAEPFGVRAAVGSGIGDQDAAGARAARELQEQQPDDAGTDDRHAVTLADAGAIDRVHAAGQRFRQGGGLERHARRNRKEAGDGRDGVLAKAAVERRALGAHIRQRFVTEEARAAWHRRLDGHAIAYGNRRDV